jgi:hypothetical protein
VLHRPIEIAVGSRPSARISGFQYLNVCLQPKAENGGRPAVRLLIDMYAVIKTHLHGQTRCNKQKGEEIACRYH